MQSPSATDEFKEVRIGSSLFADSLGGRQTVSEVSDRHQTNELQVLTVVRDVTWNQTKSELEKNRFWRFKNESGHISVKTVASYLLSNKLKVFFFLMKHYSEKDISKRRYFLSYNDLTDLVWPEFKCKLGSVICRNFNNNLYFVDKV